MGKCTCRHLFRYGGLSDVKPKPKQLQWPITTNENNAADQWELEANTRNKRQARENACDQVTIDFGFASDWSSRWCECFKPITERNYYCLSPFWIFSIWTWNCQRVMAQARSETCLGTRSSSSPRRNRDPILYHFHNAHQTRNGTNCWKEMHCARGETRQSVK